MREYEKIRSAIVRGGTSKGVFLLANELPQDPERRDEVILSIFGGTDERQIDGLGGADSLTSKLAIVSVSSRQDADIDYTFGQVGIGTGKIDYNSNCGNILSGVGPFAIDEGLVPIKEPYTTIRIYNTNTNSIIEAKVPVNTGKARTLGNHRIDGVPGKGAKIELNFLDAAGSKTGEIFPTGKRKELLSIDDWKIEVSIIDVATPAVFVNAESIGLSGTELPEDLTAEHLMMLEKIRSIGAEKLGFVEHASDATSETPSSPKVIIVSPSQDYLNTKGKLTKSASTHLTARAMSMQKMHKTFPVTGGLCTATAAKLKGTIVNDCSRQPKVNEVVIGHPSGVMNFTIELEDGEKEIQFNKTAVTRTSRRIMDGYAYVPSNIFWKDHFDSIEESQEKLVKVRA